jgi:hypothetical protein
VLKSAHAVYATRTFSLYGRTIRSGYLSKLNVVKCGGKICHLWERRLGYYASCTLQPSPADVTYPRLRGTLPAVFSVTHPGFSKLDKILKSCQTGVQKQRPWPTSLLEERPSGLSCAGRKGCWKYVILTNTRSRADVTQIWTLPKLTLVFSTTALSTLQSVCIDSYEGPAPSASQDRKPSDADVENVLIAPLGESYHKPHLFVSSGTFVHHFP